MLTYSKMPKKSSELNSSFSVQKEIMDLKSQLSEKESELIRLECSLLSSGPESTTSNSSTSEAEEWQAKYERLADAHKKLQRTNICLEEKLLKIVDKFEGEKNLINRDLATQTQKVVEAKLSIQQMHKQNTQLKSDLHVALNILQMKPNSFVSQKMESLPEDLQSRVRHLNSDKHDDKKSFRNGGQKITVAVPNGAFSGNDEDAVSAAILARVLEERENERKKEQKFCIDIGTQTHRWQFPDALQLLKHSRARSLLRDDYSLLEELSILSAAEKEFSHARKQFLADKGYLEDSDCISEEDEESEYMYEKDSLGYPKTHVSNILLASLMQPSSGEFIRKKYRDNDVNSKKEKARKSLSRETTFCNEDSLIKVGCGSESGSLKSFDLLGSNSKLSNMCLESEELNTNTTITNENKYEVEPQYESLDDLNDANFYQRKEHHQIYSSQPSSISSLLSLTQKAFTPNTLQRSFSTSSYSAVQTDM